ncbi:PIN domain nuclease, a component of toxin-antitoxin system (PIN domain) [Sphingobium sp. AP50]|uniref:type II toxin-antitoxin system VapC family toxin n=1 Tax=Sphingobium sp. AP50 TaxID=1884369 RepID=UPI0008BE2A9D|nr:type II toxin-antitoxin system VapC family toxin [Sphingobium sp. AP50]SEJ83903.1 PIN domain nuclease, a component of toxin-antitoxin system (PIN domain) [Sphingobium sp. AP50]
MRLLLDTHVLIWWLRDDPRLGAKARRIIADPRVRVMASIASPWEMSVKCRIGKLTERGADMLEWLDGQGVATLPIRAADLHALEALPLLHRDPFDHLLIAQAQVEDARIMTDDGLILRYGVPCIGVS